MRIIISWIFLHFFFHPCEGQVVLSSSNLPIIIIDSQGESPNQDYKIEAEISIIANGNGERNLISDEPTEYQGPCGIKIRGESSSNFPKKSFALEMWDDQGADMDTSFLDFPAEEDFILYGPYSDKSLVNNVLIMQLAREMGQYASRTQYIELVLNGSYEGLYVLMEKIKRDKDRVDVSKLNPEDLAGDELTGGYIFRLDKGSYEGWQSDFHFFDRDDAFPFYQFYYPNEDVIQLEQENYIQGFMDDFEDAATSDDYYNDLGFHYTKYINLRSFVDNFILNELSKNVDAYRLSTYFHKHKDSKGGKVHAGPVWDYNLSFGNADFCNVESVENWLYYDCTGNSPQWWDNFLRDETFTSALGCRYAQLREGLLETVQLSRKINEWTILLEESQERNFQRWDILGAYVWPNTDFYVWAPTHSILMSNYVLWISRRLEWLDENMPAAASDCALYDDPDFEVTSTREVPSTSDTKLFPNPVSDRLHLSSSDRMLSVVIIDALGRLVLEQEMSSFEAVLPISLSNGSYQVMIMTTSGSTSQSLIVIPE